MSERIFYQLAAKGALKSFNSSDKIYSKNIYTTREAAEKDIPRFKRVCEGDGMSQNDVRNLGNITVDFVKIVELVLIEEDENAQ